MRAPVLVLALWLASFHAFTAEDGRPVGTNCDLSVPPASAGEEFQYGLTLRIYPRAKDINANYTGCQVLLAPDDGKWVVISVVEIVGGDPTRIWFEQSDPSRPACRYKNGNLVKGPPGVCPARTFLLMKSMAPGCVDLMRAAVAKHGPDALRPRECQHE
jgi:hypothetical protein